MDNHTRRVGDDWVVSLQGASPSPVTIAADRAGSTVIFEDGATVRVELRLDAGPAAWRG